MTTRLLTDIQLTATGSTTGRTLGARFADVADLRNWGVTGSSSGDLSTNVQAAINSLGANGGIVQAPPGTIFCKQIRVPDNVMILGCGYRATTFKLPNGANTYVFGQASYVDNSTAPSFNIIIKECTVDGNKANNTSGNALIVRGYRNFFYRVRFQNCAGHGVVFSELGIGGAACNNNMSGCEWRSCYFDNNVGAGLFADSDANVRIADGVIEGCDFNTNGTGGYFSLDIERSAGWKIIGNQMYGSFRGDIRCLDAAALIIANNNIDGTDNANSGADVRQIHIGANTGAWSNIAITGNVIHTRAASLGSATGWRQIYISNESTIGSVIISGNSFFSKNIAVDAIQSTGAGAGTLVSAANAFSTLSPE